MKKAILTFAALSASSLCADIDDELFNEFQQIEQPSKVIADNSSYTPPSSVSAPSINNPSLLHYTAYGDLLYWNVYTADNPWVISYKESQAEGGTPVSGTTYDYKNVNFDWNVGFRVGVRFETSWENLIFDLNWTRFYTDGHQSFFNAAAEASNTANQGFLPYLEGLLYSASAHFTLHLNQIDFTLKKAFSVLNNQLTLLPFGGYRYCLMKYLANAYFISDEYGTTFTSSFPKNNFRSLQRNTILGQGIVAGLKGDLILGKGFKFYAGLDGAVVVGHDKSFKNEHYDSPTAPSNTNSSKKSTKFRAIADLETGFSWERLFSNNSWGLQFKAGYEAHMFFDTPTLLLAVAPISNLTSTFHGLTLGGSIEF